jgi:hypothetical protein
MNILYSQYRFNGMKNNSEIKTGLRGVKTVHRSDQSEPSVIAEVLTHPDIGEGQEKKFTSFNHIE